MSASIWLLSLFVGLCLVGIGLAAWSQLRKSGHDRSPPQRRGSVGAKTDARAKPERRSKSERRHKADARNTANVTQLDPYRATGIKPGRAACDAVMALRRKRYLVQREKVPTLPLPDCRAITCNCRYAKYRDRRSYGSDRRAIGGAHQQMLAQTEYGERRCGRDRRRAEG